MIHQLLEARKLPNLFELNDGTAVTCPEAWEKRRKELIALLSDQLFGHTPAAPAQVTCEILSTDENAFAGKAVFEKLSLSFDTPKGTFAFPVSFITPKAVSPAPLFVAISFRPDVPDKYLPIEEIIDQGYAVANFCYNDVTTDNGEETGIMTHYPRDPKTGWGKIGMWAFAASRVLDYALTRGDIDGSRVAVVGHSRLGKTALWCGAQDERFSMVISNDSGCSGAAISRGKIGETIALITQADRFPYWFCGNYLGWANREYEAAFDQHMLLALAAPRRLYVCSAVEDSWADPESEFLCSAAASPVWALYGKAGLISPDALPEVDSAHHDGHVGYHLRAGCHYLSRTDWNRYIEYRSRHGV